MITKGFDQLTKLLTATSVTESTGLDEQERAALYTAIHYANDESRRVWAAEQLIDAIRAEEERDRYGSGTRPLKPFNLLHDWKGEHIQFSPACQEVLKIVHDKTNALARPASIHRTIFRLTDCLPAIVSVYLMEDEVDREMIVHSFLRDFI